LAVAAAKAAFPSWSVTPAGERSRKLMRVAELILERSDELALAESIDNEHVTNGRAKMFFDSFTASLDTNYKTRLFTDLDSGGLDKRDLP
jgi:acyl-CoA reductase-like NAD-dependent aldehyde dehydrogenase